MLPSSRNSSQSNQTEQRDTQMRATWKCLTSVRESYWRNKVSNAVGCETHVQKCFVVLHSTRESPKVCSTVHDSIKSKIARNNLNEGEE